MSQTFPTSIPSYPDTSGSEVLGSAGGGRGLSRILDDYGLDLAAVAAKVGSGASLPAVGAVLRANGAGTSVWGAVVLTTDVTGILPAANGGTGVSALGAGIATFLGTPSSANLRAALTDETGTGAAVFATSPTIVTPTIASFANANHDHTNSGTGGTLGANTVGNTQVASGVVVQVVETDYSNTTTGTTIIPADNTVPQNTEGDQYMSQAITPKASGNILIVEADIMGALNLTSGNSWAAALFQDSTANALAAKMFTVSGGNYVSSIHLRAKVVASSTSATTFKVRAGAVVTGTFTFNGAGGAALFGGIVSSSIKITEYKA
jgi:hypothetical protein